MKINNCFFMYSPSLHEHVISTECKKPETAIKRFTSVLCEFVAGCTKRFDFGSLVRDTFNSSDSCSFDDGSFRKRFSCVDSGLMFDTTVSLTVTFHNGVYVLCIAFTSFDKTFTSSDTTEDTSDTSDTSDTTSDPSDTTSDTSDTTSDTSDTTSDTSDTTEDTTEDTTTIIFGALDSVQVVENKPFLPVPRWFYQRANIYIWSAILSAYKCWYYCDRRKRVIVKPVRISPRGYYPVRVSPYGMPPDFYPYKMFIDGLEMWDCRSRSYNEYLSNLIGAPPYDVLPF